ncbi:MAG: ATP synthase F1 subunit delta [Lentimicrobiaceae bacterium]|nr:ATP synthase F1 subunit delta [Lentimicrobiaceae bacterium]
MRRPKIARRYAKAFFEFSQELGKVEEISNDMHLICSTFQENKELRFTITSPIVPADKKRAVLNALFENKVASVTLQYIQLVLKKRREIHLDLMCSEFEKLYKEHKNIVTLFVNSVKPLEKEALQEITDKIKSYIGAELEVIERVKPQLIGGISLQFNDYFVDASIKGTINKLRKELVDESYQVSF